MIVFDRSRKVAAESCLRKRWFGYELNGRGISPLVASVPLSTGSAVHVGLQALYEGRALPEAVGRALSAYDAEVEQAGIAPIIGESTPAELIISEQKALCEALLRAYAAVRLPAVLSEFKVLATEREYTHEIADGVSLMVRVDALLERKSDGAVFIRDFKTVADAGPWWRQSFRYDALTMSQVLPVEASIGKKLGGVIIEGLCKGRRAEYPRCSGIKQQSSPLIYAWKDSKSGTWASRYEWSCTESHWTNGARPSLCEGGKNHKLGPAYYKAKVWEEYEGGVPSFVDWLLANDRTLVEEQFVELPPILRSEWEINEWVLSSSVSEATIKHNAGFVNAVIEAGGHPHEHLARLFPKNTSNGGCANCSFRELCWGNAEPDDPTMFKAREYNHLQEAEFA